MGMKQFYVPDEMSKRRADSSRDRQQPDMFSGVDSVTGTVQAYNGVVQSVEDLGPRSPDGRRYRITMFPD
jgi:hypothetical protein